MIKTIIIDDDVEMLQGLSHFIQWEEFGFTVCGFAKNGSDGLALAKDVSPDVIITDITMPSMNGLELIQEVKKTLPRVKSIILSCHEDFHYAKEAIRLGADEYMLKHTLQKEDFIEILMRIKDTLRREKNITAELSGAHQNLNNNKGIILEKFFLDILDGSVSVTKAREAAEKLKLPLPPDKFRCATLYFDDIDKAVSELPIQEKGLFKFSVLNIIENTIPDMNNSIFFAYNNIFVLLFWGNNEISHDLKLQTLLKKLQGNIETFLKVKVSACISSIYNKLSALEQALIEMENLRAEYFYHDSGALVLPKSYSLRNTEELYKRYGVEFRNIISIQNPASIQKYMKQLYQELPAEQYSPNSVRNFFERLLIDLEVLLNKHQLSLKAVKINGDTFDTCKKQMEVAIMQGIELLLDLNHTSSRPEIKQVLDYIDLHLKEAISCEAMAEMVNLNFSYFSRLFKHEMGVSFSDYLLHKRINVATNLLINSNYSIEEIIEMIGITSTSYFYRAYKKITQKTPGDVRREGFMDVN